MGQFLLQRFEPFLAGVVLFLLERPVLLRAELGGGLVHEVNPLSGGKQSEM
jgi:hypothetical protein